MFALAKAGCDNWPKDSAMWQRDVFWDWLFDRADIIRGDERRGTEYHVTFQLDGRWVQFWFQNHSEAGVNSLFDDCHVDIDVPLLDRPVVHGITTLTVVEPFEITVTRFRPVQENV